MAENMWTHAFSQFLLIEKLQLGMLDGFVHKTTPISIELLRGKLNILSEQVILALIA